MNRLEAHKKHMKAVIEEEISYYQNFYGKDNPISKEVIKTLRFVKNEIQE
jgi:hypothetical protein